MIAIWIARAPGKLEDLGADAGALLQTIRDDGQSDVSVPKAQLVAGSDLALRTVQGALRGLPGRAVRVAANLRMGRRRAWPMGLKISASVAHRVTEAAAIAAGLPQERRCCPELAMPG